MISRLPGCDGHAADTVSTYAQVEMEDAHKLLKIPKSECPDIWIRLPQHKWPKSWPQYGRPSRSSWKGSVRSSFGKTIMGKVIWDDPIEAWLGENIMLGMSLLYIVRKDYSYQCNVDDIKIGWKETKSWSDVESTQQRSWFGRTNIFPGSCILGRCTRRQCEISKDIVDNYRTMFESRMSAGGIREITNSSKYSYFLMVLWHGWSLQRNVWNDIVSWQTGRLNNFTKSVGELSEVCSPNCSEMLTLGTNWKTRYSLVLWTNLHDPSQNGPKLVTDDYPPLISNIQ